MRDRADPAAAPPRGLRVGGDADRPGHVRAPPVSGLDQPMVVAGREVEDLLASGGLNHLLDVAHDQRAPGQAAEVDGLEVSEQAVVALDRQDRLVRSDRVALVQGVDLELIPPGDPGAVVLVPSAQLQHRDRLVDPAQQRVSLLEHLHGDRGVVVLGLQQLLGVDEVGVGVVAVADSLHRKAEDRGVEALAGGGLRRHGGSLFGSLRSARPLPEAAVPQPRSSRAISA